MKSGRLMSMKERRRIMRDGQTKSKKKKGLRREENVRK
jgi:hypothetical protein